MTDTPRPWDRLTAESELVSLELRLVKWIVGAALASLSRSCDSSAAEGVTMFPNHKGRENPCERS